MTDTDTNPTSPDEIAQQVVDLTREDRRDQKRDSVEINPAPGIRVAPAPLTYKGASVEIDHQVPTVIQNAVIQAYLSNPHIECFSSSDVWSEGYRYWALKDTERTGL